MNSLEWPRRSQEPLPWWKLLIVALVVVMISVALFITVSMIN